ncbi:MAG: zinc-binding alcohol dehydrogenase family protein [Acidobacteriota bacterium]
MGTKLSAALVGPDFQGEATAIEIDGQRLSFAAVDLPSPELDASGVHKHHVLVAKRAMSCSFRDRAVLRRFAHRLAFTGELGCGFGSELVGEVVALGDAVTSLAVGDRVLVRCTYPRPEGTHRIPGVPTGQASNRFEILPAGNLVTLPEGVSIDVAAGLPIAAQTGFGMLRRLLSSGERALVTAGRSITSLVAIQLLRQAGWNVTVVTGSEGVEARLRELGAVEVLAGRTVDELGAYFRSLDPGEKFDVVVDPFADVYMEAVLPALRLGGHYVSCGFAAQGIALDRELPVSRIMPRVIGHNLTLHGQCLGNDDDLDAALEAIEAGRLTVPIDSVWTLDQLGDFLDRSFVAADRFGKVILRY